MKGEIAYDGRLPATRVGKLGLNMIFPLGIAFSVSRRHERGSTIVASSLPFKEATSVFGNQRLTGALLDPLAHHVPILEMNGETYRLRQSEARRSKDPARSDEPVVDPATGEIVPA